MAILIQEASARFAFIDLVFPVKDKVCQLSIENFLASEKEFSIRKLAFFSDPN